MDPFDPWMRFQNIGYTWRNLIPERTKKIWRNLISHFEISRYNNISAGKLSPERPDSRWSYLIPDWNILWNPEVKCRIHKGSPIIPILNRINPVPRTDTFLSLRSILKLLSHLHLGPPKALFPVGLLVKILKALLPFWLHDLPILIL